MPAVVTYTPAQLQLSVGETVTVSWTSDTSLWLVLPTSADENVVTATPVENHNTYGTFTVTGVGDGTTTITIDGYNFLGVTVGTVEDESYLNKRGLTHFWENIDDIKQDKLTAGAGISITGNTISASGVTSFNGLTGAVTYTAPVTSVNGSTGAVTGLQTTSNLVTSVSSSSTNSQYPSAKLFYDTVGNVETILQTLNNGGGAQ